MENPKQPVNNKTSNNWGARNKPVESTKSKDKQGPLAGTLSMKRFNNMLKKELDQQNAVDYHTQPGVSVANRDLDDEIF